MSPPPGSSARPEVAVALLCAADPPLDPARVSGAAAAVLGAEGRGDAQLSVTVVGDPQMAELHARYSGVPGPTDVLAFPLEDPALPEGPPLLGEVVVSLDTAAREAAARDLPREEELLRYVMHGTLHLLGYDDHEPEARARMHARQEELLAAYLAG